MKGALRHLSHDKANAMFKKTALFLMNTIKKNKLLSLIIFIAFLVRLWGLLPNYFYHPDEPWMQVFGQKLFYSIVTKGDFDPHEYKYGPFIVYLGALPHFPIMFISYFLEWIQNTFLPIGSSHTMLSFKEYIANVGPTQYFLVLMWMQRALVAIIGGFSSLILYFITKKLFNKNTALIASFFLAIAPMHVRDSHYLTTDVPLTFFILLSILFMVNLMQSGKLKWYILSGLAIGFSSTVRYFPLAVLAYPIAVIFDKQKNRIWLPKIIVGLLSIPLGLFLGAPFLFLRPENRVIFQKDMERYVLPWYETSITRYAKSLGEFISSLGQTILPSLTSLYPTFFKKFYLSLLFFQALGPLPTIAAILGIIIALIKFPKQFLFIGIIPAALIIYISAYIPATYDRLAIPAIPFLAIFIGIFLVFVLNLLKSVNSPKRKIVFAIILIFISYYPFYQSFASSIACGKKHVFDEGAMWIYKNIPDNATIASKTHMPIPSDKPYTGHEMKPGENFSLEEMAKLKASYSFINLSTVLDYFSGSFTSDFFVPPRDLHDNNFIFLSLFEYETRAKLLKKISRPDMCAQPTFLYYQLPKKLKESKRLIKSFSFDSISDMDFWNLQEYSIKAKKAGIFYTKKEGNDKPGALEGKWESFSYTAPRIVSEKLKTKENDVYTFSAWVKFSKELTDKERDGFLRIDFYDASNKSIALPGIAVALSPRTYGKSMFRKLQITAKAPPNTEFVVFSLQVNGSKPEGSFYFDDIEILGPK